MSALLHRRRPLLWVMGALMALALVLVSQPAGRQPDADQGLPMGVVAGRVLPVPAGLRVPHPVRVALRLQDLRGLDLKKLPSVSETIDWARVLVLLHANELEPALVRETLNVLLKFESDIEVVAGQLGELLLKAKPEAIPVR